MLTTYINPIDSNFDCVGHLYRFQSTFCRLLTSCPHSLVLKKMTRRQRLRKLAIRNLVRPSRVSDDLWVNTVRRSSMKMKHGACRACIDASGKQAHALPPLEPLFMACCGCYCGVIPESKRDFFSACLLLYSHRIPW